MLTQRKPSKHEFKQTEVTLPRLCRHIMMPHMASVQDTSPISRKEAALHGSHSPVRNSAPLVVGAGDYYAACRATAGGYQRQVPTFKVVGSGHCGSCRTVRQGHVDRAEFGATWMATACCDDLTTVGETGGGCVWALVCACLRVPVGVLAWSWIVQGSLNPLLAHTVHDVGAMQVTTLS